MGSVRSKFKNPAKNLIAALRRCELALSSVLLGRFGMGQLSAASDPMRIAHNRPEFGAIFAQASMAVSLGPVRAGVDKLLNGFASHSGIGT